ncbi:hypothetical protein WH52_10935 [Tenacibaculum holothuriorum]|uniref:Thioesterase n=1 Tax=Tenacibaculum holothuriorum TaxID=1635173 RepID=A0A1Y2PBL5_9FLAO|nr:thioesterase family protein [Tenacibaculum holothuriorum]OSY87391.1 hypothetical protein WH52_10935 [Tenacibaculum holothuriorum]
MTKKTLAYKGAVSINQSDTNGHMNVMHYINKYELAAMNMFTDVGYTRLYAKENNLGIIILEQQIKYYKELFEDDTIYIESHISSLARKVVQITHELYNGDTKELSGTAVITYAFLNKEIRKTVLIPDSIKNKLEDLLMPQKVEK